MKYLMLLTLLLTCFLSTPVHAATTTYVYDDLDRLHVVYLGNGVQITYEYDQVGNILSKTLSGDIGTITASASDGGVISPTGTQNVLPGESKTYTVTPLAHYHVNHVYINNTLQSIQPSYTLSYINSNQTISVDFLPDSFFTITAFAENGGSITPSGAQNVYAGESKTYSIAPLAGYRVNQVYINNVLQSTQPSYTFSNLNSNQTISVDFLIDSCVTQPVRIARPSPIYFNSIQAAYNAAISGDVLQIQSKELTEILYLNRDVPITLAGGYNCDYSSNNGSTILLGTTYNDSNALTMSNIRAIYQYTDTPSGQNPPIRLARTIPAYFDTLQAAYNEAISGEVVQVKSKILSDTLLINKNIPLTIDGGYADDFITKTGQTVFQGVTYSASETLRINNTDIKYQCINPPSCLNPPVRIARQSPAYFDTLQAAYNVAANGEVIQIKSQVIAENLNINRAISVTLDGGYSEDYASKSGQTTVNGITYSTTSNNININTTIKYQ